MRFLYIALGGGLGAIARYAISCAVNLNLNRPIPYATLIVNATGSLIIGFLFVAFEKLSPPNELRLLLITGFLGAYTTFSTYSLETARLALEGKLAVAAANFALNNALCLFFACVGMLGAGALLKK